MTKELIHQEDITFANIYTSTIRAPKYIKLILTGLKREIDSYTILRGTSNPYFQQGIGLSDEQSTKKQKS